MFGSHYEISDKEKEDEKKTRNREEGQVSLFFRPISAWKYLKMAQNKKMCIFCVNFTQIILALEINVCTFAV